MTCTRRWEGRKEREREREEVIRNVKTPRNLENMNSEEIRLDSSFRDGGKKLNEL